MGRRRLRSAAEASITTERGSIAAYAKEEIAGGGAGRDIGMVPPNPNLEWYLAISAQKDLSPRCPFATAQRCPRFFQGLVLLGDAGFTKIDPTEQKTLLEKWRKSDLWPVTGEQATSTFSAGAQPYDYSQFCPEVAFQSFGLFATNLVRYADKLDRELAHDKLLKEDTKRDDWRWTWWMIEPQHYSECPLYSPLAHDASKLRNGPAPERAGEARILEVKPTLYGIKLDLDALWVRIRTWWQRRKNASGG